VRPRRHDLEPLQVLIFAPLGLFLSLIAMVLFTCSCGAVQPGGLPGVLTGSAMVYWTLLRIPARPYLPGLLALVCASLTTLVLLKAGLDVLFFNPHGAWLSIPPLYAAATLCSIGLLLLAVVLIFRTGTAAVLEYGLPSPENVATTGEAAALHDRVTTSDED
jgi:hypothetical protein